ncbi:MAG: malate dehydrogenase [Nitrososphaerota archaeon]|nr:malate dehydrogenase [Candidatus Bathyarchaeota archaeon]MDW8194403.1 malate dehydrogenase [Nitrososphaerota archaeon]
MRKIAVIGVGSLGSCIAYEIANRGLADELVLIDIFKNLAEGNAADISQAIAFRSNTSVFAGDYYDAKDAEVVVISAGKPRTPEMKSRLELLQVNKSIIADVAQNLRKMENEPTVITLTNPVDVMNYILWRYSGFPREKVIGSAGMLDSARFRHVLSRKYSVPVLDVEAYVIGEHGDNQAPVFSKVRIKGEEKTFMKSEKTAIIEELKKTALDVISKKGATIYAPADNTVNMIECIVNDEKKLCICSAILDGEYGLRELSIGVPAILGRGGIREILKWQLDEEEKSTFYSGAEAIRKAIESVL